MTYNVFSGTLNPIHFTSSTIIRHLRCQSCAIRALVGDLPSDNVARNAVYSSPARPFILLLY